MCPCVVGLDIVCQCLMGPIPSENKQLGVNFGLLQLVSQAPFAKSSVVYASFQQVIFGTDTKVQKMHHREKKIPQNVQNVDVRAIGGFT